MIKATFYAVSQPANPNMPVMSSMAEGFHNDRLETIISNLITQTCALGWKLLISNTDIFIFEKAGDVRVVTIQECKDQETQLVDVV